MWRKAIKIKDEGADEIFIQIIVREGIVRLLIVTFVLVIQLWAGIANAGLFGPSTYEECITESMKGVASDVAARSIINACRQRFPREETMLNEQKNTRPAYCLKDVTAYNKGSFDLEEYRRKNYYWYGSNSLEEVAKDIYSRGGREYQGGLSFEEWIKATGIISQICSDRGDRAGLW